MTSPHWHGVAHRRGARLGRGGRALRVGTLLAGLSVLIPRGGNSQPAALDPPPAATAQSPQEDLGELVDDAVGRLKEQAQHAGQAALAHKDYPGALRAFERAYELDPGDPDSTRALAQLHTLLGNRSDAERYHRETLKLDSEDAETHLSLARLLAEEREDPDRLTEADQLLVRARQLGGPPTAIALSRARVANALGRFDVAAREYDAAVSTGATDATVLIEIGDFYRDIGESDEALSWYRRVDRPHAEVRLAAQRIFELEVDKEARQSFSVSQSDISPADMKQQLTRARVAASQGKRELAETLLRQLIARAPEQSAPRAQLGALLGAERATREEAERLLLQAAAMDGDPAAQRDLALLYLSEEPQKREEGMFFLRRALRLRPEYWELHMLAAETERTLGHLPAALQHVRRYLSQNGRQEDRLRALQLEQELVSALQNSPAKAAEDDARVSVTSDALHRAQVHLSRGAASAALTELARLPDSALDERVWNLRAAILQATGDLTGARQALARSLNSNDRQPEVRVRLGELLLREGEAEQARAAFLRAAATGSALASYRLSQLDAPEDPGLLAGLFHSPLSLRDAQARLDQYLASGEQSHRQEAQALRSQLRRQQLAQLAVAAALLLSWVTTGLLIYRARTSGIDTRTLVERFPETTGEVLRLLSAIRHEVLKHNTLMLASTVSALQRGKAPGAQGHHLERALLGSSDNPGAVQRLSDYAEELRALGRTHGQRLNLEHRDATLGPLLAGMRRLRRLAPAVVRADHMGPGRRRRLGRRLLAIHRQVNEQGYHALQAMLLSIRSLDVTEALLRRIHERVRSEPALAGVAIAPLSIRSEDGALPCHLELPQAAFEDVMANLLRNALQASLQSASPAPCPEQPLEVAVIVRRDEDPITGLTRAMFLICDRAVEQLDESMLRGGYIERGLGLTADLVARYDGELSVQQGADDFTKAVALALPCRAEEALCAY